MWAHLKPVGNWGGPRHKSSKQPPKTVTIYAPFFIKRFGFLFDFFHLMVVEEGTLVAARTQKKAEPCRRVVGGRIDSDSPKGPG